MKKPVISIALFGVLAGCSTYVIAPKFLPTLTSNVKKETVLLVFGPDKCPVDAIALGPDCPPGLGGTGSVCRVPGDSTAGLKKIKWEADSESGNQQFSIVFPGGGNGPCNNTVNKQCNIKDRASFNFGDAMALTFKYTVTSPDCPDHPLDPFIIVLR